MWYARQITNICNDTITPRVNAKVFSNLVYISILVWNKNRNNSPADIKLTKNDIYQRNRNLCKLIFMVYISKIPNFSTCIPFLSYSILDEPIVFIFAFMWYVQICTKPGLWDEYMKTLAGSYKQVEFISTGYF